MEKINVITLCSGYDSQCMALQRIKKDFGLDYDLIAWSEIDKYACQAHEACFPQFKGRNLGDMTAIDWSQIKQKIDLLVYSTPCQSISSAGLQHGFKEGSGTRSSIIWSTLNAIDVLKPKYLLLENVKAMVSKKFLPDFKSWLDALELRGYKNYWKVLNAKDYGVPQNRERVFVVSILGDERYEFPKPFELKLRLKDILETNVDEKYFLSRNAVVRLMRNMNKEDITVDANGVGKTLLANCFKVQTLDNYIKVLGNTNPSGCGMNGNVFDPSGISPTLTTNKGEGPKIKEPLSCAMRGRNPENPSDRTFGIPTEQRIEVGGQVANCITTVQKDSLFMVPETIKGISVHPISRKLEFKGDKSIKEVSPTIRASDYKCPHCVWYNVLTPKRTEYGKKVRKAYESGEIQESRHNMTEMQPREDGISNTITTVQKDNLLVEPKIIQVCNILEEKGFSNPQRGRVYSAEGISPTINTFQGGGKEIKILHKPAIKKGKVVNRRLVDVANTIHTSTGSGGNTDSFVAEPILRIRQATKQGYVDIKPGSIFDASYPESKTRRGRVQGEGKICPTLTSQGEPPCYYEGKEVIEDDAGALSGTCKEIEWRGKNLNDGDGLYTGTSEGFFRGGLKGISRTIKAGTGDAGVVENYHLRKLTERECFRLMGVTDADIDKIKSAGISRTQQYRMAGNSIVVDVLYHIFRNMFIDKTTIQLTLF